MQATTPPLLPGTLWPLYSCLMIFKISLHCAPLQALVNTHTHAPTLGDEQTEVQHVWI